MLSDFPTNSPLVFLTEYEILNLMERISKNGFNSSLMENPNVANPALGQDSITKLRGSYYREQGWIVNLPQSYFEIIEEHLKSQTPFDMSALPGDDYNDFLDNSVNQDSPKTYITHDKNLKLIGTERIAINPEITLWHKPAKFVVLDDQGSLKYLADTDKGRSILKHIEAEESGILDIERLVPINKDKPEKFSRILTKFGLGASLDKLPGIPKPTPKVTYIMDWASSESTIPEEYFDIYGENLKIVEIFKAISLNPKTNLLQIDNVAALRFFTQDFINNSRTLIEGAVRQLDNKGKSKHEGYTATQQVIIDDLSQAILSYGFY